MLFFLLLTTVKQEGLANRNVTFQQNYQKFRVANICLRCVMCNKC